MERRKFLKAGAAAAASASLSGCVQPPRVEWEWKVQKVAGAKNLSIVLMHEGGDKINYNAMKFTSSNGKRVTSLPVFSSERPYLTPNDSEVVLTGPGVKPGVTLSAFFVRVPVILESKLTSYTVPEDAKSCIYC